MKGLGMSACLVGITMALSLMVFSSERLHVHTKGQEIEITYTLGAQGIDEEPQKNSEIIGYKCRGCGKIVLYDK